MPFQRTDFGLINKYLFYKEPLVWVEGPTDIPFYERITRSYSCQLEPAGGKEECKKLAKALLQKDHPYVVVLDGHYDILERKRSSHRRLVTLQRHSSENYLFEKETVEQVCRSCAKIGSGDELIGDTFEALISVIQSDLIDLVILDIAHCRASTGRDVLPPKIEPLLESQKVLAFSHKRIKRCCTECQDAIAQEQVDEARALVVKFLEQRRLVDLLPGHLVFGILRYLIINTVRHKTKRKPHIDDDGIRVLLSAEVWSLTKNHDHESLKRRLRQAIREAQKQRQNS
jgi:hypothetical protein